MSSPPALPLHRQSDRHPSLGDHAVEDLRFIRRTMERAGSLTSFPGWGQVAVGVTALAAAWMAARATDESRWLVTWLVEAVIAFAIGSAAMALKARSVASAHAAGPWRRFALSFSLPILAGGVLTYVLARAGIESALPGTWMLLYGVAIAVGGAFSVASVRAMGYAFMAFGIVTLLVPGIDRNAALAAGFGGLHVGFGFWIARRHGG